MHNKCIDESKQKHETSRQSMKHAGTIIRKGKTNAN